jgi:rhodanese-related sulfurtransferase
MTERELSPELVAELLARGDAQLVDVREPYEHAAGRIAGARHVELGALAAEAETIEREKPVVFYCRVGARSAMATQAFAASGWDAYNLSGGIVSWVVAGLPIDGEVADH